MKTKIVMTGWLKDQLTIQRRAYLPEECCAIVLGRDHDETTVCAENVCPIQNISGDNQFLMHPQQQVNIVRSVKDGGGNSFVKIAAHYHSHPPNSLGRPSIIDLARAKQGWAKGIHLIEGADGLRAWTWDGDKFHEAEIEIND